MKIRFWGTTACTALASAVLFGAAAYFVDVRQIPSALAQFSSQAIFLSALMLVVSAIIAGFRLRSMAAHMGLRLSPIAALQAMAAGQIAGTIFVQFFGHIAARTALLRAHGLSMPDNIVLASYERFAALAVSLGLAAVGALALFGTVRVDFEAGGKDFIHLVAGATAAVAGAAFLGWGRQALGIIRATLSWSILQTILPAFGWTLAIQLTTALAYVTLARSIAPHIDVLHLAAASFVIMFAASLPISFAGWGVRELSAVFVLKALGIEAATAVGIAVLIGSFALLAVIGIAACTSVARNSRNIAVAPSTGSNGSATLTRVLGWLLPLMIASLIIVQIKVPTSSSLVTINPADPLAIIGGAVFLYAAAAYGWPHWRVGSLGAYVGLLTSVLLFALVLGFWRFGVTDWALYNRALGWFVLLGYAMSGAMIVALGGTEGLRLLLRTFCGAVLGIVLFDLGRLALYWLGAPIDPQSVLHSFDGLAGNRNAFAFQIIIALASGLIAGIGRFATGTLLAGIWFAGSLAGIGATAIVLVAALLRRASSPAQMISAVAVCGGYISVIWLLSMSSGGDLGAAVVPFQIHEQSLHERWASIAGGWKLFVENPIFGAGLGAFMDGQLRLGTPLVIHSTPVWIAAEMGLLGLLVFSLFGFKLAQVASSSKDPWATTLLLVLLGFGVMAGPHDIAFQRSVWLVAGALIVGSGWPESRWPARASR
jgi:hypothetical protein